MTDLFTQAELADALQIDSATIDPNVYARVLASVTAKVQGLVTHPIFVTPDDVAEIDPSGFRVLQLPHWPVVSITSVVLGDSFTLNPIDYRVSRLGQLRRRTHHHRFPSRWDWGFDLVTVTYTHGYDPVPGPIKEVALDLAVGEYSNPLGLRTESIASYSYSISSASGKGGVVDYHQEILAAYR